MRTPKTTEAPAEPVSPLRWDSTKLRDWLSQDTAIGGAESIRKRVRGAHRLAEASMNARNRGRWRQWLDRVDAASLVLMIDLGELDSLERF